MKLRQTLGVGAAVAVLSVVGSVGLAATPTGEIPVAELEPHYGHSGTGSSLYTMAMLELGMRMGAAVTEVRRGDAARVKTTVAALREHYVSVAAMVPSWKAFFPLGLVDDLDKAGTDGRDRKAKDQVIARLEENCTRCHSRYMFPVQARFRWGKFAAVEVKTDKKENVAFHDLMLDLGNGLGAIRADVASGQFDAALTVYEQVKERFTLMELACAECHTEPREYFVDSRVKGRLLKIGGMLRKGTKEVAEYNQLLNEINETSCFRCHQVHMPAAFLQRTLTGK